MGIDLEEMKSEFGGFLKQSHLLPCLVLEHYRDSTLPRSERAEKFEKIMMAAARYSVSVCPPDEKRLAVFTRLVITAIQVFPSVWRKMQAMGVPHSKKTFFSWYLFSLKKKHSSQ